jgi:putative holliday junction resolvase
MGLDVGEKRIGISVSDLLHITAQGLENYQRKGTEQADFEFFKALIKEKNVNLIVCGNPLNMNGSFGPQAEKVKAFGDALSAYCETPITYWDERLTSMEVEKIMIDADVSRKRRRQVTDMLASMRILQSYMDAHS